MATKTKRCAHCRRDLIALPKSEGGGFYRDRSQPDGLYRDCVRCVLAWRRMIDVRAETNKVAKLREQMEQAQREHAAALYQLRRKLAKMRKEGRVAEPPSN